MNILKIITLCMICMITVPLEAADNMYENLMPKVRILGKPVPIKLPASGGGSTVYSTYIYGSNWEECHYTPKLFKVSDTKAVIFSRANLYYTPATDEWGMGKYQWESLENNTDINAEARNIDPYKSIDNVNSLIGEDPRYPIDLFGWGTSGWESGAKCYEPNSTSEEDKDYFVGNDKENTLTGEYKRADWGTMYDGGRVMTSEEWDYLLNRRHNAGKLHGIGSLHCTIINSLVISYGYIEGLFLFPDGYDGKTDLSEPIEEADWYEMEKKGAIFLPKTGYRRGSTVYGTEKSDRSNKATSGNYWTSSVHSSYSRPVALEFETEVEMGTVNRSLGCAVRLVYDAERVPETMYITTLAQLKNFRDKVNQGETDINVELAADIDLGSDFWEPIGNDEHPYVGKFDGKGHEVTGMNIRETSGTQMNKGFFGMIGSGAQIKNLSVEGKIELTSGVQGASNVAGLVGSVELSSVTPAILEGLTSRVDIEVNCSFALNIAGIVGSVAGSYSEEDRVTYIKRCANYGNIDVAESTSAAYHGGIVGQSTVNKTIITDCANYGNLSLKEDAVVAGIAGLFKPDKSLMAYNLNYGDASKALANLPIVNNEELTKLLIIMHTSYNFYNLNAEKKYVWKEFGPTKLPEIPTTGATEEDLASGKTTYELNKNNSGAETWRQNLGEDPYPVLDPTHEKVYAGYKHGETAISYSNEQLHLLPYNEDAEDEESGNHETQIYEYTEGGNLIRICLICGHKTSEPATGVEGIMDENGPVVMYDLSGRRVDTSAPILRGVYIKSVNGKQSKVIIK